MTGRRTDPIALSGRRFERAAFRRSGGLTGAGADSGAHVAIALEPPGNISIQNIFPGTVEAIITGNGPMLDVRINVGSPLLARITIRAKSELDLKPGMKVYALVKSVAVTRGLSTGGE